MSKTAKATATHTLEVQKQEGKSEARQLADLVTTGLVSNAVTVARYSQPDVGVVSMTELLKSLTSSCESVNRNNLSQAEQVLQAQALTLNVMFGELARRAALNMGEHLGAFEAYMRLALKAQSQSRATFETLAAIKNPPVVFARQANISSGPQQVNNGPTQADRAVRASAHAQAEKDQFEQTELLETGNGTRMDARTSSTAGRAHSHMEAMGEVDRAAH